MSETTNSLARASSAYLRSAMHQPIQWHEWGEEAFATAQREDKPILLDIGAVWCHWCHVMDRESYENAETGGDHQREFIAVKVDRDERPDVDSRYQLAVSAISGTGGWPLTVFLTPDGSPFYGGTYFPADRSVGTSQLQEIADGDRRCLSRAPRRGVEVRGRRDGACRRREFRRPRNGVLPRIVGMHGAVGVAHLRREEWRLRRRAEVSPSRLPSICC